MQELCYRPMVEERLYSITEAAAKLGVSPATIATWIRLGIASASRQDELGRNRYTDADLVEMERRFLGGRARQARGLDEKDVMGANPPPSRQTEHRLHESADLIQ